MVSVQAATYEPSCGCSHPPPLNECESSDTAKLQLSVVGFDTENDLPQ